MEPAHREDVDLGLLDVDGGALGGAGGGNLGAAVPARAVRQQPQLVRLQAVGEEVVEVLLVALAGQDVQQPALLCRGGPARHGGAVEGSSGFSTW